QVLMREQDFDVIEASTTEELRAAVARGVDAVLIDEALPPNGALAAVHAVAGNVDHIIVWSLRPQRDRVLDAIRAGATGYLRKEISAGGLVRSLRGASKGESPLSRDLAALMIDALHEAESPARATAMSSGSSRPFARTRSSSRTPLHRRRSARRRCCTSISSVKRCRWREAASGRDCRSSSRRTRSATPSSPRCWSASSERRSA